MALSRVVRRLGGALTVWGAFISLCALQQWWLNYGGLFDSGLMGLGLLLLCSGTVMERWRPTVRPAASTNIVPFPRIRARQNPRHNPSFNLRRESLVRPA
jgi:hypothetical protein